MPLPELNRAIQAKMPERTFHTPVEELFLRDGWTENNLVWALSCCYEELDLWAQTGLPWEIEMYLQEFFLKGEPVLRRVMTVQQAITAFVDIDELRQHLGRAVREDDVLTEYESIRLEVLFSGVLESDRRVNVLSIVEQLRDDSDEACES